MSTMMNDANLGSGENIPGTDSSTSAAPEVLPKTPTQVVEHWRKLELALDTIVRETPGKSGFSDGSRPNPDHAPTSFDHRMWDLGWTDGRQGKEMDEKVIEDFCLNQARIWVKRNASLLKGDIDVLTGRKKLLEEEREARKDELEKTREINSEVASGSLRSNPHFYRFMSMVLILFGLLPLVADITVTSQLATKSLGFTAIVCVDEKGEIVSEYNQSEGGCINGGEMKTYQMGSKSSFGPFLDITLLALALTSGSFLLKLLIDALAKNEFRSERHRNRSRFLLAACILFLSVVFMLGLIRNGIFNSQVESKRIEVAEKEKRIELARKTIGSAPSTTDANKQTQEDINRWQLDITQAKQEILAKEGWYVSWGFILLTVLLPVVSGTLFHFGAQYWHQYNVGRFGSEDLKDAEIAYRAKSQEVEQTEGMIAQLKAISDSLSADNVEDSLARQWHSLYSHGHLRGLSAQETFDSSTSLFNRAHNALVRRIS